MKKARLGYKESCIGFCLLEVLIPLAIRTAGAQWAHTSGPEGASVLRLITCGPILLAASEEGVFLFTNYSVGVASGKWQVADL